MRTRSLAWAQGLRALGLIALAGGGLLQVWAAPGGAQTGPTLTLTPAGPSFSDTQKITVGYAGFRPNFDLIIRQCTPSPQSGDDCDILTLVTSRTDGNGAGARADYELRMLPRPELDSGVVCNASVACVIVVSEDLNDLSQPKAVSGPITVGQGTGPTTSSTTSSSTTTSSTSTTSSTTSSTSSTTSSTTSTTVQGGETTTTTLGSDVAAGGADSGGTSGGGSEGSSGGDGGPLSRTGLGRFPALLMVMGLVSVVAGTVVRARALRVIAPHVLG